MAVKIFWSILNDMLYRVFPCFFSTLPCFIKEGRGVKMFKIIQCTDVGFAAVGSLTMKGNAI